MSIPESPHVTKLKLHIQPDVLREACRAWDGITAILRNDAWRGLLYNSYTQSLDSHIEPESGAKNCVTSWPKNPAYELPALGTGLPISDVSVGDTPLGGCTELVYLDSEDRRGVIEYNMSPLPGEEPDSLLDFLPGLDEDMLGDSHYAWLLFRWNRGYRVKKSVCVVQVGPNQEDSPLFCGLSLTERIAVLSHL